MVRGRPANRFVKRARIFAFAKGFRGRSKNVYSIAVRRVHKALQYQYVSRKLKKRDMRSLWITRINIATREHNLPYSTFMCQLAKVQKPQLLSPRNTIRTVFHEFLKVINLAYIQSNIPLNRKMLSELAVHEPRSFKALTELARRRLGDGLLAAVR